MTHQSGLEQYLAYSNESEVTLENLEELASLKSVSVSYWDDFWTTLEAAL